MAKNLEPNQIFEESDGTFTVAGVEKNLRTYEDALHVLWILGEPLPIKSAPLLVMVGERLAEREKLAEIEFRVSRSRARAHEDAVAALWKAA